MPQRVESDPSAYYAPRPPAESPTAPQGAFGGESGAEQAAAEERAAEERAAARRRAAEVAAAARRQAAREAAEAAAAQQRAQQAAAARRAAAQTAQAAAARPDSDVADRHPEQFATAPSPLRPQRPPTSGTGSAYDAAQQQQQVEQQQRAEQQAQQQRAEAVARAHTYYQPTRGDYSPATYQPEHHSPLRQPGVGTGSVFQPDQARAAQPGTYPAGPGAIAGELARSALGAIGDVQRPWQEHVALPAGRAIDRGINRLTGRPADFPARTYAAAEVSDFLDQGNTYLPRPLFGTRPQPGVTKRMRDAYAAKGREAAEQQASWQDQMNAYAVADPLTYIGGAGGAMGGKGEQLASAILHGADPTQFAVNPVLRGVGRGVSRALETLGPGVDAHLGITPDRFVDPVTGEIHAGAAAETARQATHAQQREALVAPTRGVAPEDVALGEIAKVTQANSVDGLNRTWWEIQTELATETRPNVRRRLQDQLEAIQTKLDAKRMVTSERDPISARARIYDERGAEIDRTKGGKRLADGTWQPSPYAARRMTPEEVQALANPLAEAQPARPPRLVTPRRPGSGMGIRTAYGPDGRPVRSLFHDTAPVGANDPLSTARGQRQIRADARTAEQVLADELLRNETAGSMQRPGTPDLGTLEDMSPAYDRFTDTEQTWSKGEQAAMDRAKLEQQAMSPTETWMLPETEWLQNPRTGKWSQVQRDPFSRKQVRSKPVLTPDEVHALEQANAEAQSRFDVNPDPATAADLSVPQQTTPDPRDRYFTIVPATEFGQRPRFGEQAPASLDMPEPFPASTRPDALPYDDQDVLNSWRVRYANPPGTYTPTPFSEGLTPKRSITPPRPVTAPKGISEHSPAELQALAERGRAALERGDMITPEMQQAVAELYPGMRPSPGHQPALRGGTLDDFLALAPPAAPRPARPRRSTRVAAARAAAAEARPPVGTVLRPSDFQAELPPHVFPPRTYYRTGEPDFLAGMHDPAAQPYPFDQRLGLGPEQLGNTGSFSDVAPAVDRPFARPDDHDFGVFSNQDYLDMILPYDTPSSRPARPAAQTPRTGGLRQGPRSTTGSRNGMRNRSGIIANSDFADELYQPPPRLMWSEARGGWYKDGKFQGPGSQAKPPFTPVQNTPAQDALLWRRVHGENEIKDAQTRAIRDARADDTSLSTAVDPAPDAFLPGPDTYRDPARDARIHVRDDANQRISERNAWERMRQAAARKMRGKPGIVADGGQGGFLDDPLSARSSEFQQLIQRENEASRFYHEYVKDPSKRAWSNTANPLEPDVQAVLDRWNQAQHDLYAHPEYRQYADDVHAMREAQQRAEHPEWFVEDDFGEPSSAGPDDHDQSHGLTDAKLRAWQEGRLSTDDYERSGIDDWQQYAQDEPRPERYQDPSWLNREGATDDQRGLSQDIIDNFYRSPYPHDAVSPRPHPRWQYGDPRNSIITRPGQAAPLGQTSQPARPSLIDRAGQATQYLWNLAKGDVATWADLMHTKGLDQYVRFDANGNPTPPSFARIMGRNEGEVRGRFGIQRNPYLPEGYGQIPDQELEDAFYKARLMADKERDWRKRAQAQDAWRDLASERSQRIQAGTYTAKDKPSPYAPPPLPLEPDPLPVAPAAEEYDFQGIGAATSQNRIKEELRKAEALRAERRARQQAKPFTDEAPAPAPVPQRPGSRTRTNAQDRQAMRDLAQSGDPNWPPFRPPTLAEQAQADWQQRSGWSTGPDAFDQGLPLTPDQLQYARDRIPTRDTYTPGQQPPHMPFDTPADKFWAGSPDEDYSMVPYADANGNIAPVSSGPRPAPGLIPNAAAGGTPGKTSRPRVPAWVKQTAKKGAIASLALGPLIIGGQAAKDRNDASVAGGVAAKQLTDHYGVLFDPGEFQTRVVQLAPLGGTWPGSAGPGVYKATQEHLAQLGLVTPQAQADAKLMGRWLGVLRNPKDGAHHAQAVAALDDLAQRYPRAAAAVVDSYGTPGLLEDLNVYHALHAADTTTGGKADPATVAASGEAQLLLNQFADPKTPMDKRRAIRGRLSELELLHPGLAQNIFEPYTSADEKAAGYKSLQAAVQTPLGIAAAAQQPAPDMTATEQAAQSRALSARSSTPPAAPAATPTPEAAPADLLSDTPGEVPVDPAVTLQGHDLLQDVRAQNYSGASRRKVYQYGQKHPDWAKATNTSWLKGVSVWDWMVYTDEQYRKTHGGGSSEAAKP
jgi:hypothetical protein